MDTPSQHADARFVRQLHRALQHLYDPAELRHSPLIELLGARGQEDPPSHLRRLLLAAVAALKPGTDVPPNSNAWRIYHVLSRRYAEQFTLREVANNMALSVRHLARLESQGVQVLADRIWAQYDLGAAPSTAAGQQSLPLDRSTPSRDEELQWLKQSQGSQVINTAELMDAALDVVAPLAQALGVRMQRCPASDPLHVVAQPAALRQALVNALTMALRQAPDGELSAEARKQGSQVQLAVRSRPVNAAGTPLSGGSLAMVRELIELAGGNLSVPAGDPGSFTLCLTLPIAQQLSVLVIDDNVDTLRLLERYLAGTRYRFTGTSDPQQALPLAEELKPQIIVLDVMLPEIDGWELLGRLHEHPVTRQTPIIVCSILAEEDLALALGAAGLIRKPVTQQAFLAALDRQSPRLDPISG